MATRTCPSCGTQYVATVRSCIDCGAALVADASATSATEAKSTSTTTTTSGDREQIGYELPGWGNQLKVALDGMLEREGVPRVWGATELLVPAEFEAAVDRLIEVVEGTDLDEPADDEPQVALEIEGLDQDVVDDLEARLLANAVPHVWSDEGELLIAEADEERVLELIDAAFEMADDDGDDAVDVQAALSSLYVSVDRLAKRPDDHKRVAAFVGAAEVVTAMSVPYGFEAAAWQEVVDETTALVTLVGGEDDVRADDDEDGGTDDERDDERGETATGSETGIDDELEPDEADEDGSEISDDDDSEPGLDELIRSLRDHLREIV